MTVQKKVPNNHFLKPVWKSNCSEVHCGTLVIINMTHTCMECYTLSGQCKQLIKVLTSCLWKLDGCFFLKYGFKCDYPENSKKKKKKKIEKVPAQELVIGFWTVILIVKLSIVEFALYTLSVETIATRFNWLTCRKQNLVQSKILQQGLCLNIFISL